MHNVHIAYARIRYTLWRCERFGSTSPAQAGQAKYSHEDTLSTSLAFLHALVLILIDR